MRFDPAVKLPLQQTLPAIGKGQAQQQINLQGWTLPCTVSKVISSGIVEVNIEVNAAPWTLPHITVPIQYPEYIRFPIAVGDKGLLIPASARLGGITGLGSGTPDLSTPANLSALSFVWLGNKNWSAPQRTDAVEIYAPSGFIAHDTDNNNSIDINSNGTTTLSTQTGITLDSPATTTTGDNTVQGDFTADGTSTLNDANLTGTLAVTGEVTINGTIVTPGGGGGGGTVTSVAVESPDGSVIVGGSPVTSAGTITVEVNPAIIPSGPTVSVVTTVNLTAGKYVSFGASGLVLADATDDTKPAHGFVLASYSSSATAVVYLVGAANTGLTGLTPGANYYLGTAGDVTDTLPTSGGLQYIGTAATATALPFVQGNMGLT